MGNNFCSRCGSALVFEDDVVKIKAEITYRSIDEAKIKESEAYKAVQMRGLEVESQKERNKHSMKNILLIIWGLSLLVLIYLSVTTADHVNFSPYQIILVLDIILGYKIVKGQS